MMLSLVWTLLLPFTTAFVGNTFKVPYSTKIKPYGFLHEEPSIRLNDVMQKEPTDSYDIVYDMMGRVLGSTDLLSQFSLKLIIAIEHNENAPIYTPKSRDDHPFWSKASALYLDIIELDNDGEKIILRGSSTIALAVAFNWYLEDILNTTYDWHTYSVDIPSSPLPLPPYMQKRRSVPFMYYQNVCTVSYTFAFWDWTIWEKHIDWMAMQGINMPLAFNGQEYIFAKTFAVFNFTSDDLQSFFAGPAFYAWQRMGNIQGWGGPLRESEIMNQYYLQLQILARMYTFEMTPALTCFSGHVPKAITTLYPNADVSQSPHWNAMNSTYCCVALLNFLDPLFQQIGSEFIHQQTQYYGTSHIYQCDTFNEMNPATNDSTYLKSATSMMYAAMNTADEDAIWLMQGWLFLNRFWNSETVFAYLSGVPNDAMIILDLNSASSAVYKRYQSYYGKAFIWNTLHDFGGNDGIMGNLGHITDGFVEGLKFPNTTIMGVGTTMEGIWQNYIVYDTTYKMGYRTESLNLTSFGARYAYRRYGLPHTASDSASVTNAMVEAWSILVQTLYNMGGTPPRRVAITGVPSFTYAALGYDPVIVQSVWKDFVSVGYSLASVESFGYDLVDVTRQAMAELFNANLQDFIEAYNLKDVTVAKAYANRMMDIIADVDRILLTNRHWMLGTWIEMARNQGDDEDTKAWYEFNARNQITLWGPNGQINNYACKQWGDMIGMYYLPQWHSFLGKVIECMESGTPWDQNAFDKANFAEIELPFSSAIGGYHTDVVNDTIVVACHLYKKWNMFGDETC